MTRDELINLIETAIDNVHDMDVTHRDYAVSAADAVLAALMGMVKPLEWRDCPHQQWRQTAKGQHQEYAITDWVMRDEYLDPVGADGFWLTGGAKSGHEQFETIHDAKAAAENHYRAQIMAALDLPPAPDAD